MHPTVGTYLKAEEDGLAPLFIAVEVVGVAEVVHIAMWSTYHRAVAAALKAFSFL